MAYLPARALVHPGGRRHRVLLEDHWKGAPVIEAECLAEVSVPAGEWEPGRADNCPACDGRPTVPRPTTRAGRLAFTAARRAAGA